MLWFNMALLSGFFAATADLVAKRSFSQLGWAEMTLARVGYPAPFFALGLFFVDWSSLTPLVWLCLAVALPLEVVAVMLYNQAIFYSPLSLTVPFLSFTPVFALLTGWLILGEGVSPAGGLGVCLVVAGCYLLNLRRLRQGGWLAPIKAVGREPGSWRMLVTSGIYAITAVVGKLGFETMGPINFLIFYFALFYLIMAPFLVVVFRPSYRVVLRRPWPGLAIGGLVVGSMVCHALGITLIEAAYLMAAKRVHILFGAAYGLIFFKEGLPLQRLLGAGLALAGVVVLALLA